MSAFQWQTPVRFRDCDPAGIVFYPRYFEMLNNLVETFFDEAIGWSFAKMHGRDRVGVPMAALSTQFSAPSRLGDLLDWSLAITRVGGASADLSVTAAGGGELRLSVEATLVLVDIDIRARLAGFTVEAAA